MTVEGYKYEKASEPSSDGHRAVYLGPGKAFVDEEGHTFARNEPLVIDRDTAAKLRQPPYREMFAVLDPNQAIENYDCCVPTGGGCCGPALVSPR